MLKSAIKILTYKARETVQKSCLAMNVGTGLILEGHLVSQVPPSTIKYLPSATEHCQMWSQDKTNKRYEFVHLLEMKSYNSHLTLLTLIFLSVQWVHKALTSLGYYEKIMR